MTNTTTAATPPDAERCFIVMEGQGRESAPLALSDLYRRAQQNLLWHDTMIFDQQKGEWIRASTIPALRIVFQHQAQAKTGASSAPAVEESKSLWQRLRRSVAGNHIK